VSLYSHEQREIKLNVTEVSESVFEVAYIPPHPGEYLVRVDYDGSEVPQSPIKVQVGSAVDVSKIKVLGLEPGQFILSSFHTLLLLSR